jgi:hypothetical protein
MTLGLFQKRKKRKPPLTVRRKASAIFQFHDCMWTDECIVVGARGHKGKAALNALMRPELADAALNAMIERC